jgi:hypothetical protein
MEMRILMPCLTLHLFIVDGVPVVLHVVLLSPSHILVFSCRDINSHFAYPAQHHFTDSCSKESRYKVTIHRRSRRGRWTHSFTGMHTEEDQAGRGGAERLKAPSSP